jgi:hypothetical protein
MSLAWCWLIVNLEVDTWAILGEAISVWKKAMRNTYNITNEATLN